MKALRGCGGVLLASALLLSLAAVAQNTYEEPNRRFVLELPKGWKLAPQENEYVYIFKGAGTEQIAIAFLPGSTDREQLFGQALEVIKNSMPDAAPDGEIKDLEVNGHPARWGIYRGTVETGQIKMKITLFALVGSVAAKEEGLYFVSFVNEKSRKEWEKPLEKVFQSLRLPLAEQAGARETKAEPAPSVEEAYEELNGRFLLDLPKGWKLAPQQNENLYLFKGRGAEQIILLFDPAATDRERLFTDALDVLKSGMADATPEGQVTDLEVNGQPARWGIYRGTSEANKTRVTLFGLVGSVALPEGGVYFVSFLNEKNRPAWEKPLQQVFQSIRMPGAEKTGARGAKAAVVKEPAAAGSEPAKAAAAPPPSGQPTPYSHERVSLTLPPGWVAEPITPNMVADGVVGKFSSEGLTANMVLGCYNEVKKWYMKKKGLDDLYKEAKGIMQGSMPTAQSVEGPYELKTADGKKIRIEVYKGFLVVEGKETEMHGFIAAAKTRQCTEGLTVYAYVGSNNSATALPQMKDMVLSAR